MSNSSSTQTALTFDEAWSIRYNASSELAIAKRELLRTNSVFCEDRTDANRAAALAAIAKFNAAQDAVKLADITVRERLPKRLHRKFFA